MDKKAGIQPFNYSRRVFIFIKKSFWKTATKQQYFHQFVSKAAATGMSMEEGVLYAWRVGCVANLVSGIIATLHLGSEDFQGIFVERISKVFGFWRYFMT